MNEPEHPHFVLSDAQYCHVTREGFIIAKKNIPEPIPAQNDKPDLVNGLLLGAGAAILTFLVAMCAITGMYIVVFLLGMLDILVLVSLFRLLAYSQTNFIPRDDVSGVEYKRRNFGYDWFIVHYTGKNGKHCKRRLAIYDSQECLTQALHVMKSQGFLK